MFKIIQEDGKKFKNLINGEWKNSKNGQFIQIDSVIDDSVVGYVPALSKEEVDEIFNISYEAQKEWKKVPLHEKTSILYKVADILTEKAEEFTNILCYEIGKDKKSAKAEVLRTADFIRFTADTAKGMSSESITGDNFPGGQKNKIGIISREPLGVVLAISPFNYPINLAASKIAPAIVIGNSVVLKSSTQGCISGLHLARVFEEAGVPKGVIQTVTGKGSEIGDYITAHPKVNFINFTGSTQIGQHLAKNCGMIPLMLELGGKDAAIVLEDADLELTSSQIISGAFSYSGQRCTAIKRVLVIDTVADELVKLMCEKIKNITTGNPLNGNFDVVPLINKSSADFVWSLIEDAKEKGATLLFGGEREGTLIYPTLMDNITTDMKLAWEEPFGPVLPIIRVKSQEEAIKIANESEYGLQSSVFTKDIDRAFEVANELEVGTVQINNKTERGPDHFPFLGVKASGLGTQGIKYSIEAMSRPKLTVVNLNKK